MSKKENDLKAEQTQLALVDVEPVVNCIVVPQPSKLPAVDPFSKSVDVKDVFRHQQLDELQEIIKTAIAQRSMVFVGGPPGVGKTTAVRSVTDTLPANKFTVVYLGQDQSGANLLNRFLESMGVRAKRYRAHVLLQLSQWLADNLKDNGKNILVVIDEAHLLDDKTLEDLRLLSNADYDQQSPFTLILIAQPWLRARLKSPFFEPLAQRIRYRYSLEGLSLDETILYVRGRLSAAGEPAHLFTDDVLRQIFSVSEGIPRRINNICSQILLKVKVNNMSQIDAALIKQIADLQDM